VDAAKARHRQALALEPPTVGYEFGKLGTPASTQEREASLRFTQGFPLPVQRSRAGRVARIEVMIAEASRDSRRLSVQGEVIRSYRRLQADLATVGAFRGMQGTLSDLVEATEARLRTGGAKYLDVLRARAEAARLENDLLEAEHSLRADRHALNTLLARSVGESLEPADSLVFVPLRDSLPQLLVAARESRPALRAARLKVDREQAAASQARSALLPSPEVSFGYDRVPGIDQVGIGGAVSLRLPFVPWTDRRARLQESNAAHGAAQAELEASERNLEQSIHDAYEEILAGAAQMRTFEERLLPDVTDAVRAATRSFQVGQIDGLELFETLRTYRTVQQEHLRALLNYHLALSDLRTVE
jgi:outer membrane protein TolC